MKLLPLILTSVMALQTCAIAQSWPKRTIPVQLAEDAVIAAQKEFPDDKQKRCDFIDSYRMAFLFSLRCGGQTENLHVGFSDDVRQKGYDAGVYALNESSNRPSISPEDFGYVIKELEGEYIGGFEKSEFTVEATGERYHLNKGRIKRMPRGRIKIWAYVSPESPTGYGHFGGWKREIIVVRVLDSEQNEGEPAGPGYPPQGVGSPDP